MSRAIAMVVVAVCLIAGGVSVARGVADETIADINGELHKARQTLARTGANMPEAQWKRLESDAQMALKVAPGNAHYWDALARVHYMPRVLGDVAISPDYPKAYLASRQAVVTQPSSAYTWSALLYASDHLLSQQQLPGGKAALEQAVTRTVMLGQREPQAARGVVDIGLANYAVLGSPAKRAVNEAVRQLSLTASTEVLAIAERRGALQQVCGQASLARYPACQRFNPLQKTVSNVPLGVTEA